MKISLEQVQKTFNESLRRANCQTWDAMAPFVEARLAVTKDGIEDYATAIEFDIDRELDPEKDRSELAKLSDWITNAVSDYVQWPGRRIVELLHVADVPDVTIPAGCEPGSPEEIQSAFKRATEALGAKPGRKAAAFTMMIPTGSQDFFYAALDGDQPATMFGHQVRLVPCSELLDAASLEAALPAEGLPPADYVAAVEGVARTSPWYVVAHAAQKPFVFLDRQRPRLLSTPPTVQMDWRVGLYATEHLLHKVVRVAPSKLTIAKFVPKTPEAAK